MECFGIEALYGDLKKVVKKEEVSFDENCIIKS